MQKDRRLPRCIGCKHWQRNPFVDELGECNKLLVSKLFHLYARNTDVSVETAPDFGCVEHEPRGG